MPYFEKINEVLFTLHDFVLTLSLTNLIKINSVCEFWSSHSSDYEDYCLTGLDNMYM
jgi:hypothetical protein